MNITYFLQANSKILKENAEMINEYFSIHVDHDGNLTRLPVVLDQYTPDMDRLPEFVLTMGNDVGFLLLSQVHYVCYFKIGSWN